MSPTLSILVLLILSLCQFMSGASVSARGKDYALLLKKQSAAQRDARLMKTIDYNKGSYSNLRKLLEKAEEEEEGEEEEARRRLLGMKDFINFFAQKGYFL
eukprot:TRINITY_DN6045_c1_g1_i11.p5 TRINITY_DN6045_c1_g1~~TRINITY_DN6045_c1_g1_i11.p5  ORF type:complete len:101 (-),score=20.22 TRINITY_DN6045_c1_g1_i11:187-489(-)